MTDTTDNAFLGGRLNVLQPKIGYRAGADPVFLAAAVAAKPGQSVLDLGSGVGTALLCLGARVPGLSLTGVEVQPQLAALGRGNLSRNGMVGEILEADVAALPADLRQKRFDHVITNPPFFDRQEGSPAKRVERELGRGETISLEHWLDAAMRRVAPAGTLTLINRIERLPDCLACLGGRLGSVTVLPLAPRQDRPAKLFVLAARRDRRGPFSLRPPFVLHQGDAHEKDGESYTQAAQTILRDGGSLALRD